MPPEPIAPGNGAELATALTAANLDLRARVADIERAVGDPERLPTIVSDAEQAGRIAEFVRQCTAAEKQAVDRHDLAKRPYLTLGRLVDGFFNGYAGRVRDAKAKAQARLTNYLNEKSRKEKLAHAAEQERHAEEQKKALAAAAKPRPFGAPPEPEPEPLVIAPPPPPQVRGDYGAVASLVETWEFEIEKPDKIPLATLRPYLPRAAIEQAIRGYIRAGGRKLTGVRIFQQAKARTR